MTGFGCGPFPTLTTARLVLREVVPADAEDILAFRGDRDAQQYNTVPMRTLNEALALIHTMQSWYVTRYAIQWGITLRGEHRVLGLCGLHDWNRQHRRAAIGYDLVRTHWGQGLATEAIREVVRFGFETLQLNRIEAISIVENHRSIRLLERLGLQLEGVRRQHSLEADGAFHDNAIYALLRRDYRPETP